MEEMEPIAIFIWLLNNPFTSVEQFLRGQIISGLRGIVAPLATIAFIGLGIAAMLSTDEHQRQKFKTGLWWTGLAAIIAFSAETIADWIKGVFDLPKQQ